MSKHSEISPSGNQMSETDKAKPKKKRRRGLKITIVAVLAVAAVGGGMLLAHFDVFNSGSDELAGGEMTMEEFFAQEGDTSFDLIDKAHEEGKIDKETSLVYGAYAAFGDERLPEEYNSDVVAFEANHVFAGIQENYDSFSPENKEIIDPFLKRPDDPESWWNNQTYQELANSDPNTPDIVKTAEAKERAVKNIFTEYLVTADGKVKVWYAQIGFFDNIIDKIFRSKKVDYFNQSSRKMAEDIKKTLDQDKIYSRFLNDAMKKEPPTDGSLGGDNRLDIYTISPIMMNYKRLKLSGVRESGESTGPVLGGYIPDNSKRPTSGYIILIGRTKTIIAHELFHAFQGAFKHDGIKDLWFIESSAVWSEDLIYPRNNSEQKWLRSSPIASPQISLDNNRSLFQREYGAYIFPFYLTQSVNYSDNIIGKIWAGCGKNGSCLNSIDKNIKGGFKEYWREFTLWNYNKHPVELYEDEGGFPEKSACCGVSSHISKIGSNSIKVEDSLSSSSDMEYLTAAYTEVFNKTNSSEVKQIVFKDFKNFTDKSDAAAIKAIVYPKNGDPYLDEEWTNKEKRRFCLEDPKENIDHVVLIFSNGEIKKKLDATNITAEAKSESCYAIDQEDKLTAKIETDKMAPGVATTSTVDSNIKVKTTGNIIEPANEEVEYGYQSKWEAKLDYEEQWDSFNFYINPAAKLGLCTTRPGKTTHTATFKFDLSSAKEGGTFSTEVSGTNVHYDPWQGSCTVMGVTINEQTDPIEYSKVGLGDGMIYDMKDASAKIKFPDSFAYGDKFPYRTMEPIVLEIERGED